MDIYRLTDKGRQLAKSIRGDDSPEWRVIYFLGKRGGTATKEHILGYVPGATSSTLIKLRSKQIITNQG